MNGTAIERVFRAAGGRIIAALAARFRDLSLAEDAFSDSCVRALTAWQARGMPDDPAAWLYQVATRVALDMLRRQQTRRTVLPDPPPPAVNAEDIMIADGYVIPDERLRLIFICCHPAVAADSRAALTLRLVCGLTVTEIARAFLVEEARSHSDWCARSARSQTPQFPSSSRRRNTGPSGSRRFCPRSRSLTPRRMRMRRV